MSKLTVEQFPDGTFVIDGICDACGGTINNLTGYTVNVDMDVLHSGYGGPSSKPISAQAKGQRVYCGPCGEHAPKSRIKDVYCGNPGDIEFTLSILHRIWDEPYEETP